MPTPPAAPPADAPPAAAPPAAAPPAAAPAAPANPDKGFPDGTPIEQMTGTQREAYWKHQAQRWEGRSKKFDGMTDDAFAALKDKAAKHDTLARESMSDRDRAVAEATDKARVESTPRVVRAEFRAAAKGVISTAQLEALLEDRDLSKYADDKGEPDVSKIESLIKRSAPAAPARQTGPSPTGLGQQKAPRGAPGDQGRAMAERRFGKPATTT